jgi:antitoxin CptB
MHSVQEVQATHAAQGKPPADGVDLNRLRWRCRRGLLENDLFIERLFARHGDKLNQAQAQALMALMDLSDNDLLDLLLARREPQNELDRPDIHALLGLMRRTPSSLLPQERH